MEAMLPQQMVFKPQKSNLRASLLTKYVERCQYATEKKGDRGEIKNKSSSSNRSELKSFEN
jgi:hypothetical protein